MITDKLGAAATGDIELWTGRIARESDEGVQTSVYHDSDSSTYVIRLAKRNRVLLFRLSEAQVRSPDREGECEKTLKAKIKDLGTNH